MDNIKFGSWSVDEDGNLFEDVFLFEITSDRLVENNWWHFLLSNSDINLNDFIRAYFAACKIAKIEKIEVLIDCV